MIQQSSLRSGTLQDRNVTTAWHPCTTEEPRLPSWSMTSPTQYVTRTVTWPQQSRVLCHFCWLLSFSLSWWFLETFAPLTLPIICNIKLVSRVSWDYACCTFLALFFIFFSLKDTFTRAKNWVKELQRQASPNIVIALAGNKADLANKRAVDFQVKWNLNRHWSLEWICQIH